MPTLMRRKGDKALFTARDLDQDEEIRIGALTGTAVAGSKLLTPVDGGDPIAVHPDDLVFWEEYDPSTATPAVDYLVLLKMQEGHPVPVYVAHVPLEGDDVKKLGAKAAVEVVVDSLTVRDHRAIEAVYVTTADKMEQVPGPW